MWTTCWLHWTGLTCTRNAKVPDFPTFRTYLYEAWACNKRCSGMTIFRSYLFPKLPQIPVNLWNSCVRVVCVCVCATMWYVYMCVSENEWMNIFIWHTKNSTQNNACSHCREREYNSTTTPSSKTTESVQHSKRQRFLSCIKWSIPQHTSYSAHTTIMPSSNAQCLHAQMQYSINW